MDTNGIQTAILPANERQARAIAQNTDTPEQQVEVWKAVVEEGKPIADALNTVAEINECCGRCDSDADW